MVLGKLPVPGRPIIHIYIYLYIYIYIYIYILGQGPTAHAVCTGGGCLDIFSRRSFRASFSLSLGDGSI